MAPLEITSERAISAPAATVYGYIANMREHHPNFLPPAFSDFKVESGGSGAGTVIRYTLTAGGRTRRYEAVVAEPEPGRVLTESDKGSTAVTTFTVTPTDEKTCSVRITIRWEGAGGIGGFFERTFAPRAMRPILADELNRLDDYARAQATA
jgi:hypothetical protein